MIGELTQQEDSNHKHRMQNDRNEEMNRQIHKHSLKIYQTPSIIDRNTKDKSQERCRP